MNQQIPTELGIQDAPILVGQGLTRTYVTKRSLFGRPVQTVQAVRGVDVSVAPGQTLGIVGESGSGKSTLGRMLSRLEPIDGGRLRLAGRDLAGVEGKELQALRREVQMIFQDPYGSLDPTKTAAHAVYEPLQVHGLVGRQELMAKAEELADRVALDARLLRRYPDQLSGGQRQRIAIARALSLGPRMLVADEPTSALDLSTRSEILNLLLRIQERDKLAIVLISHDFTTVRHLSHHIAVMYLGRIVEQGPAEEVATNPQHPYTQALVAAVPVADPARQRAASASPIVGDMPTPTSVPDGCPFRTRCPEATSECAAVSPKLAAVAEGHRVACILRTPHANAPSPDRSIGLNQKRGK